MSEENVEVVRKALRVRERSRRTLDQRLAVRFPRLASAGARLLLDKLPPGSRLRQAVLWRGVRLGLEAYNRRDMAAVGINYHPEFEYHPARNFVEAGLLEPRYRGLEGHRRYVASTAEVFGAEVYVKPVEMIDVGKKCVVLANVPMRAQASGIRLTETFALVMTFADGMVIRTEEFYDYAEALEAGGLSD